MVRGGAVDDTTTEELFVTLEVGATFQKGEENHDIAYKEGGDEEEDNENSFSKKARNETTSK